LLENALISTLLIPANSCNSLALASSHLLATALCTLIVHSSSLIVAHPIKHRAFIDAKAGELLALARRAERGARSEGDICARHRRHATVSIVSFAFPEGGRAIGRVLRPCAIPCVWMRVKVTGRELDNNEEHMPHPAHTSMYAFAAAEPLACHIAK
jgi:hypothetical protein